MPADGAGNKLAKRTNPSIGKGIDVNDKDEGGKLVPRQGRPTTGAFSNVQELLDYAVFDSEHRDKVKKVLLKLMGDPTSRKDHKNEGAGKLGQITFQGVDTPNTGDDAGCTKPGTRMYTEYYDTEAPVTVVCEDAWVFPDRDDQDCDELGDTLSDDFPILGHLVLHEYSHWDWFLRDIAHGSIVDQHGADEQISGYGLENAYHDLDKNYAWYTTEVLWSILCNKEYKPPGDDDSD
ncbi:MAG: hypothetical protein Q9228_002879 [Teloschistes exilis]